MATRTAPDRGISTPPGPSKGGTCRLILEIEVPPVRIGGEPIKTAYRLRPIVPQAGSEEVAAFRITKLPGDGDGSGGESYDVALSIHGHHCTCADFEFRRDGADPGGCKHIRALRACGIL